MTGTPNEAQIQAQWRNAAGILQSLRAYADGTMAVASGPLDDLLQSLHGEYTPVELASWASGVRSGLSALVSPGMANQFMVPVLFEYARFISDNTSNAKGFGSGYRSPREIFGMLYEYFANIGGTEITVQSRNITFAVTGTAKAGNVGNGVLSRLTVDENNYEMEAVTLERKIARVRSDSTSGAKQEAEVFEVMGEASSFDNLLRASHGSGESARATIVARHAGSGNGGSLLNNSSFSDFSATSTPKFTSWTETAGSANISQDAVNYYRSYPGSSTDASIKFAGTGGTTTITQPLTAMRVRRLDPDVPYFLRAMIKTAGSADGDLKLSIGSKTLTVANAAFTGAWQEVLMPIGVNSWYRSFNQIDLSVVIQWLSPSQGTMLVDDVILAPMNLIDGSYWIIRANDPSPVAWKVDDAIHVTDTQPDANVGKIQYFNWLAGYGYLPHTTGTPTFTDPT